MKTSINPRTRHTLRGIKRCPSCGEINGQRSLLCRNEECELRRSTLANRHPFDPVALVVTANDYSLFSLRSKERDAQPRNFVTITEVKLALEEPNSAIVSRNAICFVDTCKYDACDATDISCKHIRACTTTRSTKSPLPQAEVYKVSREVLWNLNIETEQKQRLWDLCRKSEEQAQAVQRLNVTIFAVKCARSKIFPAGWLHVTALSNGPMSSASKKGMMPYACACKKLKIIVEPDNSVVMQEEICDHLLLVLAAILSKQNGKTIYGNFTNSLKAFWMPSALETPVVDASQDDGFFAGLNINIAGDGNEQNAADDIFIFGNEYLADDTIPDFSDIVLDLSPNDIVAPAYCSPASVTTSDLMHPGDPNLVSSCAEDDDIGMQFSDVVAPAITATHLELSDCNIELMDQFHQLTDQIDLCSDDIALPADSTKELFDTNSISILASPLCANIPGTSLTNTPTLATTSAFAPVSATNTMHSILSSSNKQSCSLLKSAQLLPVAPTTTITTTTTLPPIELPTIAVVKKCALKAADIVTEVRTRKFPHIPAKRALIVNSSNLAQHNTAAAVMIKQEENEEEESPATEPSLSYSAWLEHIIEVLNDSIDVVEKTEVMHTFHVHEELFAHFSKNFSVGVKWRMPNATTVVKSGKHKGLIKYTWYFTTASTVRRIFSTKNMHLELERAFERSADGIFVPYVRRTNNEAALEGKHRRIYPKLALFIAHMWFDCGDPHHKAGLKLEWLPHVFPNSHFGILNIEFSLGIRNPHNI